MAATQTRQDPTDKICAQLKSIEDRLAPADALMKLLEKPASAAGLSPVDFIAKMTAGGTVPYGIGGDGAYSQQSKRKAPERYKSLGAGAGEFLTGIFHHKYTNGRDVKSFNHLKSLGVEYIAQTGDKGVTKAALAESTGVTGGYTVPPMFAEQLLAYEAEAAIIEPMCTKFPMTSLTLQIPSLDMTTAQGSGNTPFYGGIKASWNAESASITETEPTFRQTELTAHQLSLFLVASNTLLADNAVGLDALLTTFMSGAMRWYKELSFLQGTGVGQPLGVLNAPAAISVSRGGGANTIIYTDIVKMYAKMWFPDQTNNLVWMASQSTLPQILAISDLSGGTGSTANSGRFAFTSFDQGAVKKPDWMLLGHPLYFTEKLPKLGTAGDLMLIDWSRYCVGQRMEIAIDVSPHVKFQNNQMVWRAILRVDGQPWLNDKITLANTDTISPFIYLT